ncbi:MAG: hypothetical protein WAT39_15240 [Planctomycetota bacterium]
MTCLRLAGVCLLIAACAGPAPAPRIDVQVAADEFPDAWPPPLVHHPRIVKAWLGEVVAAGIWTVYFEFAAADAAWLADLRRQHREWRITMAGHELNTDGRIGYVMHLGGKANAQALLDRLGVGGR